MKYFKITTSCNFVGCETEHAVACENESEAAELGEELALEDVGPSSWVEEITREEAEDLGIEN